MPPEKKKIEQKRYGLQEAPVKSCSGRVDLKTLEWRVMKTRAGPIEKNNVPGS